MNNYRPYADLLSTHDRSRIRYEVIKGIAGCLVILAITVVMMILFGMMV